MNIFVHRASECLTDHESHGDGLICFSLLNGLAERGHQVYAYANAAPIETCSPNLHVRTGQHKIPANSLAPWEHSWRAERWMRELEETVTFDLVWRMHPYGGNCPAPPKTHGKPLVVGPLFYNWPMQPGLVSQAGRPRLGVGLQRMVGPAAERGWRRTLDHAALIVCATDPHAASIHRQHPRAAMLTLPVIVEPPPGREGGARRGGGKGLTLLFVANLVPNKNPHLFCETIQRLRDAGVPAQGVILGDGPERAALEAYCAQAGIDCAIQFKGKVANAEVYRQLRDADLLVSASLGEPYGRSIAEAMSVGTPAVCHRSGGPADFIEDGCDGLLVNELTAAAYAERIAALLSHPGAAEALAANARQKAHAWRAEAVLDTLEAKLREVAAGASRDSQSNT